VNRNLKLMDPIQEMTSHLRLFGRFYSSISIMCLGITLATGRSEQPSSNAKTDAAIRQAADALYDGIRTETLRNGLSVYLKPIKDSPVVSTLVAYKVGSADEDLDHTGLSHYLEHLMFKGTDKIMPGDVDRLTLRNGGMNNAYTTEDYTVYFFEFAADRWQEALSIEADRMRNLRIDARHEFEQEKGAVVAELERDEDEPFDLEQKTILPFLFGQGPYGHPVIGVREQVRGATAPVIKSYYDRWYHPNNAVLVVCGGFDPDQAMTRIRELFGPIPRGTLPDRKTAPPPTPHAPIHKEIPSKFELPRMIMGFPGVRSGDADFYALDLIQAILTNGKTGRLYKKMVEGAEIASAVSSSNNAGRYPGWFSIQVELLKGKDRAKAEGLVLDELKMLAEKPVSEAELKRVKQIVIAGAIFRRESVFGLADSIARGVTTNDLEFLRGYLPRIQAVTAQEIAQTARKYLNPESRAVVWSVPREVPKGAVGSNGLKPKRSSARREARNESAAGHFSLEKTQRVVLPNGLTLLLFENHRLPIVVATAHVRWTSLLEPAAKSGVATLVGNLLDEGTSKHTGPQIAEMIENIGGSLSFTPSGGTVKVLSPYKSLGLGLLFECLVDAAFPEDAFLRQKAQQLSAVEDAERQPDTKARMVYKELAYGKHPFGRPALGKLETVKTLTPADCQDFHSKAFVPENTVVAIVGDFDSHEVVEEIKRLTAAWKNSGVPKPTTPAVDKPKHFVERVITLPDAAQLHFLMGHVGIPRSNPDYYKLLVMDYVLGTGPGFTDRLSARLRDRSGLAYTVSANITSSAGEEPGLFTCYIGTNPEFFPQVKKGFLEELNRIRAEKPTQEEVEDAKKYLLGNLVFHFTTNDRIAEQLLYVNRYHLGPHYLEDYRKAVAAVTPEDVQEVARKYLDPERMYLVIAGAVDQQGKPLGKSEAPKKP
jgi:zinc protease